MNRKGNFEKARRIIEAYADESMLTDVWRSMNPEVFRYTYFQSKNKCYARLDYLLVNHAIMPQVISADILPAYKSDHSPTCIKIELNKKSR